MIDLVGNEGDAKPLAGLANVPQFVAAHHHAVGLAGLISKTPSSFLCKMLGFDRGRGHGEAVFGRRLDRHRFNAKGLEDIAVGRIARRRDRHRAHGIKEGEKRQREATRGAGRDGDALRRDRDAIAIPIMPRDARPQLRAAQRLGIANFAAIERGNGNFPDGARRRRPRFADFQMDNVLSFAFPAGGASKHIQGMKGATLDLRDKGTLGDDFPAMNGFFVIFSVLPGHDPKYFCVAKFAKFWI